MKSVNAGTRGTITLSDRTVALSGDATDLALALAGTINHNGAVTVTDGGYNVSELAAIAGGTSGTITLNDKTVALSGSATDLATIFGETFSASHTGSITISGSACSTQLSTISSGSSGSLTYSISDTVANVSAMSNSNLIGASSITAPDAAGTTGSILDLGSYSSASNLSTLSVTGDSGINQVEL